VPEHIKQRQQHPQQYMQPHVGQPRQQQPQYQSQQEAQQQGALHQPQGSASEAHESEGAQQLIVTQARDNMETLDASASEMQASSTGVDVGQAVEHAASDLVSQGSSYEDVQNQAEEVADTSEPQRTDHTEL
jgi:hypothetical protein